MRTSNELLPHGHAGAAAPEPTAYLESLAYPEPVVYNSHRPLSRPASGEARRPTGFQAHERAGSEDTAYKFGSMSSGQTSFATTICSTDLEKKSIPSTHRHSNSRARVVDLEKDERMPSVSPRRQSSAIHISQLPYAEEDLIDEPRLLQAEKAVKILLYLSGPCVILSALNAGWTFISLFITILAQPVRICARRPSFGQQLGGLLGPALNLQFRCIYTPLPPHADEDTTYRPGALLFVQLLSPLFAIGMALAAWAVAVYWVSSAVVGDPAGTDKRDDGREAVLALRDWWHDWLARSIMAS